MHLRFNLLLLLFLSLQGYLFAQEQEICATVEMQQQLQRQFPEALSDDRFEQFINEKVAFRRAHRFAENTIDTMFIPVVVHVIHDGSAVGQGTNISSAQVESQIVVLNEDFQKIAGTRGDNDDPVGTGMPIQFVLAVFDEEGVELPEHGINRVPLSDFGLYGELDKNTVQNTIKAATSWNPDHYFNMWVVPLSGGLLGYAQFPVASGLPGLDIPGLPTLAETDGVVMHTEVFGSKEKGNFNLMSGYDLGRVTTHEVGHWIGLRHIWGDGDCSADDYCEDTPNSSGPNRSCGNEYSCGSYDMVENYMDYTADACKNIFTVHQKERSMVVMENSPRRKELLNSPAIFRGFRATATASQTTIKASQQVLYTVKANAEIDRLEWVFEGGETEDLTLDSLWVTYPQAGAFDVRLTAYSTAGDTSVYEAENMMLVLQPQAAPLANVVESKSEVLTYERVFFRVEGEDDVAHFEWHFEGGSPEVSYEARPVVMYADTGRFDVRLKVENILGSDEQTYTDLLRVLSGAEIALNTDSLYHDFGRDTTAFEETVVIYNRGESDLQFEVDVEVLTEGEHQTGMPIFSLDGKVLDSKDLLSSSAVENSNSEKYTEKRSTDFPELYDWQDITSTGYSVGLRGDDTYKFINLPFNFPFYEEEYSRMYISTNGLLGFGNGSTTFNSQILPNTAAPNNLIAMMWKDLVVYSGRVFAKEESNRLILQFNEISSYSGGPTYTFQAILYSNGNIKLQYRELSSSTTTGVIGIENADGTEGILTSSSGQSGYDDTFAVLYQRVKELVQGPNEGVVAAGDSTILQLYKSPLMMSRGRHEYQVNIHSNDSSQLITRLPVVFDIDSIHSFQFADSIDWGIAKIGVTSTRQLNFVNTGNFDVPLRLQTSGVFTVSSDTVIVPAFTGLNLPVSMRAEDTLDYRASLYVQQLLAAPLLDSVSLTGTGVLTRAKIRLSTDSIAVSSDVNRAMRYNLLVFNDGEDDLEFSVFSDVEQVLVLSGVDRVARPNGYQSVAINITPDKQGVSEYFLRISHNEIGKDTLVVPLSVRGMLPAAVRFSQDTVEVQVYQGQKKTVSDQLFLKNIGDYSAYVNLQKYDLQYLRLDWSNRTITGLDSAFVSLDFDIPFHHPLGENYGRILSRLGYSSYQDTVIIKQVVLPNAPPTPINSTLSLSIEVNELREFDMDSIFSDADGDPLNYTLHHSHHSINHLVIMEGRKLKVMGREAGVYQFRVEATDIKGGSGWLSVYLNFMEPTQPRVTRQIPEQIIPRGGAQTLYLYSYFNKGNGMPLTFSVQHMDNVSFLGAEINGDQLLLTGIAAGERSVTVRATDHRGGWVESTFLAKVADNHFPELTHPLPTSFGEHADIQLNLLDYFSDQDNDLITFELEGFSADAAVNACWLSGNTLFLQTREEGSTQLQINVQDEHGGRLTHEYSFGVSENSGPSVRLSSEEVALSTHVQYEYNLEQWFHAGVHAPLTYELMNFHLDGAIEEVKESSLTLFYHKAEERSLSIKATDQIGQSVLLDLGLILTNNEEPIKMQDDLLVLSVGESKSYQMNELFYDAEGDPIFYKINSPENEYFDAQINNQTLTITPKADGIKDLAIEVTDHLGRSRTHLIGLQILRVLNVDTGHQMQLSPNPFRANFELLHLPEEEGLTIFVHDVEGRAIMSFTTEGQSQLSIDSRSWAAGVYLLTIRGEGGVQQFKIVKLP